MNKFQKYQIMKNIAVNLKFIGYTREQRKSKITEMLKGIE